MGRDIPPLRQVSKWFCAITHDPKIWGTLYANASYLRPPGASRTAAFERAFVQSARLDQSWTSHGLQTSSRVTIPFNRRITDAHLVGGRWFLVCQSKQRFVLYDTIADKERRKVEPQVVWKQKDKIIAWSKSQGTSEQGECVVYVLMSMGNSPRLCVRVLSIR